MRLKEICNILESFSPLSSQESYDNCGLLIGDKNKEITSVLVCLDCTEEVIHEAIKKNSSLVIAHHPIIFKGIKSLNNSNYVERVISLSIKNDIAIYAMHTNLDNNPLGVNYEIGNRLKLNNLSILRPKMQVLTKLVVYVPETHLKKVDNAIISAGAGEIGNYDSCHFRTKGIGTFRPLTGSNPTKGELNNRSEISEYRIEYIVSSHKLNSVLSGMFEAHPYEEVAHDIFPLKNKNKFEGSGMIGELTSPSEEIDFLDNLKKVFRVPFIKHTKLLNKKVKSIAFCGGSGSFLIQDAIAKKADVFVTSDIKYHDFFDAEDKILLVDIGHYEIEQYTMNLISVYLKKKISNFAVHLTDINTNPVIYR